MAISSLKRIRITKYLLLAGICVISQAFVMQPEKTVKKAEYKGELAKYFLPPQLPVQFCNAEPRVVKKIEKKSKKNNKRIQKAVAKAIAIPRLLNPVIGATHKSIISFFGDARDSGRRHEGIDIVAPKGTMVVAPAEGEVVEVSYNSLGGKVIWVKDQNTKRAYYFAHLDSQFVAKGMLVKAGDTLGTVGNTGNARHTRSHLHFGIYKAYRKKDGRAPVEYIRKKEHVMTMFGAN